MEKQAVKSKGKGTESGTGRHAPLRKVAAVLSAVLWTVGLFLAFIISPRSPYIWVPDFLLLVGFFPLLLIWNPAWPWLVYGFVNLFVGFMLEVARFVPAESLPADMRLMRAHLADYHHPLTWILVGAASFVYGVTRILKGWLRWLKEKMSRSD